MKTNRLVVWRKNFIWLASIVFLGALSTACSDDKKNADAIDTENATKQELADAIADRDMLIELMTEISDNIEQIKQLEGIMTSPSIQETPDKQAQIRAEFNTLRAALQERREKLAELEKKLSDSNASNSKLRKTIETLKEQIASKETEIASLQASLAQAGERIEKLDIKVDSLNTVVGEVENLRQEAEEKSENLSNELNLCYYAIGSSKELKEHKILESGFLRKTKLMKGDFDQDFFTSADKRTLTTLDLNSKKAEVLTNQPTDSYVIEDRGGRKVLRILNPVKFWSLSNYLVVKID